MTRHPRTHAFLSSLALCLTIVALAVVLSGCKTEPSPGDPSPTPTRFTRASGHPCRC